jgi:hypothetical protein
VNVKKLKFLKEKEMKRSERKEKRRKGIGNDNGDKNRKAK